MAHAPGTTPKMWRRALYGYLAHGMTMIVRRQCFLDLAARERSHVSQRIVAPMQNLYELRPCLASYTENYVDAGWGMYAGVRQGLAELSLFEDIVQSGSVASGDVGICKHQTIQSSESTFRC